MQANVTTLDLTLVVLYVLGTVLLGPLLARRQKDMRTYFVGDRNVSWWLVLFSIVATETSTVTFLSVPGVAYNPNGGNLTFLQLSFGYVLGRIVIAWFLLPQYFQGELLSAYQLLRQRFNPTVQRTASGLFLATRTVADGLRLYLTGLLLQQFTGWDMTWAVVVMGGATLVYTYLGGMEAVIWTDLIQFVIYILGAVVAAAFILHLMPGGFDQFLAAGREAGKLELINLSTDPAVAFTLWAGVVGGAFFTMASHGADQMMVQRYLCSRTLNQARAALVTSGVVVLTQFLLFLLIGVGLFVLTREGLVGTPPAKNDEVFGWFIVSYLPPGVIGLVIAAVLAAAMSTLSSSLNSSANAFVNDFYRPLVPGRSDHHYLYWSRGMTAFWGVAQVGVALGTLRLQTDRSVIDWVLSVAGFTTGMILGLFLLGSLRHRVQSRSALVGLVAGFLAVLAVWIPSTFGPALARLGETESWFSPLATGWSKTKLAWPWYAPLGTTVTVLAALLVNRWMGTADGSPANGGPQPGLFRAGPPDDPGIRAADERGGR